MSTENVPTKKARGFAAMDKAVVAEIARKGGIEAHKRGTAHRWDTDAARAAGKLGGQACHRRKAAAQKPEAA